ncbi:uncharacterized protein LOC108138096 [Drosophila elegans]|uniref:uncharacterized protein LOC108138096 n=1 Tax=Drosophila elegans TaxID=30023 RepID=UPI0007E841A3|nr:uncharacterized protein LOC108138096 [Drosophila elegans]
MQRRSVFVVLALCNLTFGYHVQSPIYNKLCGRTGGSINCYQDNTWGFDERTRKCYRVHQGKEPCGFFDGEKGCKDFCRAHSEVPPVSKRDNRRPKRNIG